MDAATGLIYVGNGQYYDPATGRFITRGALPGNSNPYLPGNFNPSGALIGPLALLAMFYRRKKGKPSAVEPYLFLLVLALMVWSVGVACWPFDNPTPTTPPPSPTQPPAPSPTPTPTPLPTEPPAPPPVGPPCPGCTPTPTPTPSLALYGIVFGGTSWTSDEQTKILAAVQKVGEEFSRVGLGGSSWDAFKAAYGNTFLFHRDRGGTASYCNGGTQQHTIICYGAAPMSETDPARLLVHELGHALVQTRDPGTRAAYTQVRNLQMVVDGPDGPQWVTGTHPTWNDCQANRFPRECAATSQNPLDPGFYGKFQRTGRGYLSNNPPYMYHGSNWGDWSTSPSEDYADMFMNWAYNTFASDDAGTQRYNFMENNMSAWIGG